MGIGPWGTGSFGTLPFSNTPFYNTQGLIDAVLKTTGHSNPSVETTKRSMVLTFINNRYARVVGGKHWDWLSASLDTTLEAPYSTGTVALTQGSEDVVGTGTTWSANVVPYNKLVVGNYVNLITSVESTTELTLEGEWSGETSASSTYKIVKPIFTLPADCLSIKSMLIDGIGELVPLGLQEFRRKQQYDPGLTSRPGWYTEIARRAEDGIRLIEVWPAPEEKYNVHLDYNVQVMALTDTADNFPLIPDKHRHTLYYGALSEMYTYLSEPDKSAKAETDYQRSYLEMMNDTQLTDSRFIVRPSRKYQSARRNRRYRVAMDRGDFSRED